MAATKTGASVTDWTAVAQNAVGESAEIDFSASYGGLVHIQAFLTNTTAHAGTEFIVQGSSNSEGNEDWYDICRFVDMVDTAEEEALSGNEDAAATVLEVASTTNLTVGDIPLPWRAIEDDTLTSSELFLQVAVAANTSVTALDGMTNAHTSADNIMETAFSRAITIGIEHTRVRVVVNNTYDSNGATIAYRVRSIIVSAL